MNNISQIYQSLGKQESIFDPITLTPILNCLTPWNINYKKPRTESIRKSDSGVDNILRTLKTWNNKMNKTSVPIRQSLKRTSFCFQSNKNEAEGNRKFGIENSKQRLSEFTSSLKNIRRMKIKNHNEQEELKKHLSIGKLPFGINSNLKPFNHTLLAIKTRSKSRIETRNKNIQMIRHISHKKVNLE